MSTHSLFVQLLTVLALITQVKRNQEGMAIAIEEHHSTTAELRFTCDKVRTLEVYCWHPFAFNLTGSFKMCTQIPILVIIIIVISLAASGHEPQS